MLYRGLATSVTTGTLSEDQYKNTDESEKHLYEEFRQGLAKKYRLKTPCPNPDELYSNSFFLIKHQIRLPVPSNNSPPNDSLRHDILEFFTLYTNIAPAPERDEDHYRPLDEMRHETEIAFYEEYKFKVVSAPHDSRSYTLEGIQKIFYRSLCYFKFSNNQFHACMFFKHNGIEKNAEILINKNRIELIHDPEYKTNAPNVPIYEVDMPFDVENREIYRIGYLSNPAYFRGIEFAYQGNADFLRAKVKPTGVLSTVSTTGITPIVNGMEFIVPFANIEIDTTGMGYYKLNTATPKENGIMIYDGKKEDKIEKYNVLGILTGGTEFELEDPQEFWRQYNQTDNFFVALKRETDTERKRYLYFKKRPSTIEGQDIEVLIKRREKYKSNDPKDPVVICDGTPPNGYELLDHDTLLGKSVEQVAAYRDHYDLVLLFNKEKTGFLDAQALDGYRIPAGAELYNKVINNNETQFSKTSNSTEEKIVLKGETASEAGTGIGTEYRGFFYKGKLQYMLEREITRYSDKILDWDENFIKIGRANNNVSELMKEICQLVREYYRRKNRMEIWLEREWNFRRIIEEPLIVKQLKRKLVCRHPLEWDKTLYARNGSAPLWLRPPWQNERFMEKVEATDIWSELKGKSVEGLDFSENDFIFVHPVYFADYLDREGLLTDQRIRKLKVVQDETVAMPCFKRGDGRGMYSQDNSTNTYCNHAAYITIQAVDEYYRLFIGNPNLYTGNNPPWDISALAADFRNILTTKGFLNGQNYFFKESNIWCDILAEQAARGILVELPERQAQKYANMGYVVIGAWKNAPGYLPPHYATVRPGFKFESLSEIMLANVGWTNGILNFKNAFGMDKILDIKWYYNPNQRFQGNFNDVLKYLGYR